MSEKEKLKEEIEGLKKEQMLDLLNFIYSLKIRDSAELPQPVLPSCYQSEQ